MIRVDAKNTFKQHLIVGVFALLLILIFTKLLEIELTTALGRTSFILLFLVLLIGPVTKFKMPKTKFSPIALPWSWRGELGIWFALTGLIHFIIIWQERSLASLIRIGGSGFSLANLVGLVALIFALFLAATSFGKVIKFLGIESWKWLHGFVYVIFYLICAHFIYFSVFFYLRRSRS